MNLQEFAALKAGDKISNPMNPGSSGTISKTSESGVHVKWGSSTMEFYYSVNTTAWTHWTRDEDLPAVSSASHHSS
jgi:hypothetical protein